MGYRRPWPLATSYALGRRWACRFPTDSCGIGRCAEVSQQCRGLRLALAQQLDNISPYAGSDTTLAGYPRAHCAVGNTNRAGKLGLPSVAVEGATGTRQHLACVGLDGGGHSGGADLGVRYSCTIERAMASMRSCTCGATAGVRVEVVMRCYPLLSVLSRGFAG